MRILWFNWRDITHPQAGGAEQYAHQIMRRLVMRGYDITLFTAQPQNAPKNENIDGIKMIRSGGTYSVYRKGISYYQKNNQHFDLVIDGINVKPFLGPKYAKTIPILPLFYQRADKIWHYETPFPLDYLFRYYLEEKWLTKYRGFPILTISKSSKEDLEELGFKKIFIIPIGLNVVPLSEVPQKEPNPTLIFLGRLKKYKLPDHALEAFNIVREHIPEARLWIIGSGPMQSVLENRNHDSVTFYGRVDDKIKYDLLSRAHLLLVPSIREGWGLVVTESNAMGTPALAYNVHGLRDAVKDGETGVLIKDCTPESLADAAIDLLKNTGLLRKYSENALTSSRQFNWDYSVDQFEKVIKNIL